MGHFAQDPERDIERGWEELNISRITMNIEMRRIRSKMVVYLNTLEVAVRKRGLFDLS